MRNSAQREIPEGHFAHSLYYFCESAAAAAAVLLLLLGLGFLYSSSERMHAAPKVLGFWFRDWKICRGRIPYFGKAEKEGSLAALGQTPIEKDQRRDVTRSFLAFRIQQVGFRV